MNGKEICEKYASNYRFIKEIDFGLMRSIIIGGKHNNIKQVAIAVNFNNLNQVQYKFLEAIKKLNEYKL